MTDLQYGQVKIHSAGMIRSRIPLLVLVPSIAVHYHRG